MQICKDEKIHRKHIIVHLVYSIILTVIYSHQSPASCVCCFLSPTVTADHLQVWLVENVLPMI